MAKDQFQGETLEELEVKRRQLNEAITVLQEVVQEIEMEMERRKRKKAG